MESKEYVAIIENISTLRAEVNSLTRSVDGFREEVLRMLNDHENRLQRMEKFNAKYEDGLSHLTEIDKTVEDNARATANMRKFLWAIATATGTSLFLVLLNMIIENGEKLQ